MDTIFKLTNVSVSFARRQFKPQSLKHALATFFADQERERFQALTDVSFSIQEGEHVGIIGRNGAGKSTLLRVMTRVITPQAGGVYSNGNRHIVPLLELGIGFHPDLSGRENCYLSGILMGYTRAEIMEKMEGIVEFSELGEFFEQAVKTYSSGMYARLAFALATDVRPEVLLVDEVFGVGDEFFMRKCIIRMQQLMQAGTTTVFVSHNLDFLATQCDRLIWLEKGRVVMDGCPSEVAGAYRCLEVAA
jgi:ABC-type polysaccharide/polyol phosphate transport system ATPase subunit